MSVQTQSWPEGTTRRGLVLGIRPGGVVIVQDQTAPDTAYVLLPGAFSLGVRVGDCGTLTFTSGRWTFKRDP